MIPFQTPEFNPADADLINRVHAAPEPDIGFRIGGSVHHLNGERWMILGTRGLLPGQLILAYPLPVACGDEVEAAIVQMAIDRNEDVEECLGVLDWFGISA